VSKLSRYAIVSLFYTWYLDEIQVSEFYIDIYLPYTKLWPTKR